MGPLSAPRSARLRLTSFFGNALKVNALREISGGVAVALKLLMAISGSAAAVGGLYAGAMLTAGETYPMSLEQTRTRLAAMSLPPQLTMMAGGSDKAKVRVGSDGDSVTWTLPSASGRPATFIARLHEEGPLSTRVTVEYRNAQSASGFATRLQSTGFLRSYAETSFVEQVDAQLDGRPFDQQQAMEAFAQGAARNPEQVRELGETVTGILTEVSEQAAEATRAQAPPPLSASRSMEDATRPSIVLPEQR